MRTAAICPTCATYVNALCVIYDGPGLTNINVAPLDNLEDIIQNINDNLVPISGAGAPTGNAIYEGQIYIDTVTEKIYIAITTGTGEDDWVELALQSSFPTPQSLADVLLVGNSSITPIVMQNLTTAPTVTATISFDKILFSDTLQDMVTEYRVNSIRAEDVTTGDYLEIALDNAQNQTITFPDNSGQLALLSDTQLDLQDITDNGNLTDNPVFADSFSATPPYVSNFVSLLGYVGNGTTAYGTLSLKEDSTGGGFTSTIAANVNLTANRTLSLPDSDGTIALVGYKKYVAKISQTGAAAITVDYVYENTLTNPVTFGYSAPGIYTIDCLDFDQPTTIGFFQQGGGTGNSTFQLLSASGTVTIVASIGGVPTNGLFNYSHLEIRVYP